MKVKSILQCLASLTVLGSLSSCTTYVDPNPTTTTTTTQSTETSPYVPGASVTTRKTTTTY